MRSKLLPFIAAFLVAIPACGADWTMFRGNSSRTGYCSEKVGVPSGSAEWVTNIGARIVSSPSVVGGKLFIGSRDNTFYAVDVTTGNIVWSKQTGGWVDSSPLLANGLVFVGSRDGKIYVLDQENGDSICALQAGLQLSSPAIVSGKILTGLGPPYDGFASYTWTDGRKDWSFTFPQLSYSSPAVAGNRAAIGASDGRLYCLDLDAKDTLWSVKMKGGGVYLATPAISGDTVYFSPGSRDSSVYAVSLTNGAVFWKSAEVNLPKKSNTDVKMLPTHIYYKALHKHPNDRKAIFDQAETHGYYVPPVLRYESRALAKRSATNSWYSLNEVKTSSVAVDAQRVYIIRKELGDPTPRLSLTAYNKETGIRQWRFSEDRDAQDLGYCGSPVIANGKVFFGWGEGKVYALDTEDGSVLWEDSLDSHILSSPAISNGALYIATMGGKLYKYSLGGSAQLAASFDEGTYCYPNPAKGSQATIQVFVTEAANAEITLYNLAHRPVFRASRSLSANEEWQHPWSLANVANGVYLAKIIVAYSGGRTEKKILKLAVMK